jgi:hypothetical protein
MFSIIYCGFWGNIYLLIASHIEISVAEQERVIPPDTLMPKNLLPTMYLQYSHSQRECYKLLRYTHRHRVENSV